MKIPDNLFYTRTHEWASIEDGIATVGITEFAQQQLSDVTYIELPAVGDIFSAEEEAAVVESVKAASDIYSPVTGEVVEVNEDLPNRPELVNKDPYGEGWLFKVRLTVADDRDGLIGAAEYRELVPDAE